MQEYVVVDLETTGLDPYSGCEIIEIGITEIKNDQIVRNYSRLIKPQESIPPLITEITGITNEMVRNEETIETVLPRFRKFLNYYLRKYDLPIIENHICTLEMLKKCKSYKGKNKKLETACNYYNIVNENAHRADSDTKATAQLFLIIKDEVFPGLL